jgi:hypothetical protein
MQQIFSASSAFIGVHRRRFAGLNATPVAGAV